MKELAFYCYPGAPCGNYREYTAEELKDPEKLAKMSENMSHCGVPDATNRITDLILDYVK